MSQHYLNQQIEQMCKEGYSFEQIAEALNLDVDQVRFVIEHSDKDVDLTKLDKELQLKAKLALRRILSEEQTDENKSAQIAAAKIILSDRGKYPDVNIESLQLRFTKMRERLKSSEKIIDATEITVEEKPSNEVRQ
jgi:hypothetical protein